MKQVAGALLMLPDGRLVMQRRTKDAPTGAGLLSFFGGGLDDGEEPLEGLMRELQEETDLPVKQLDIEFAISMVVPPRATGSDHSLQAHMFRVRISSKDFQVFKGDGAEVYGLDELKLRADLTGIAQLVLSKVFWRHKWV